MQGTHPSKKVYGEEETAAAPPRLGPSRPIINHNNPYREIAKLMISYYTLERDFLNKINVRVDGRHFTV